MDYSLPSSPPTPANENARPFLTAGDAMEALCRLRRELLAKDMNSGYTIGQWRHREQTLRELDKGIAQCLGYL